MPDKSVGPPWSNFVKPRPEAGLEAWVGRRDIICDAGVTRRLILQMTEQHGYELAQQPNTRARRSARCSTAALNPTALITSYRRLTGRSGRRRIDPLVPFLCPASVGNGENVHPLR
jgi:hypothetical protein